jgi:hypothetical protein
MNAQTFNALMKQVPRLTLSQRELLKKRLEELDEQQKGLAIIESPSATESLRTFAETPNGEIREEG